MSAVTDAVMTTSANSEPLLKLPPDPDVLADLLHAMSQPLTGLRCSLELSLEHSPELSPKLSLARSFAAPLDPPSQAAAKQHHQTVVIALQQTEKVIGMVQLLREYVDAEQLGPAVFSTALLPSLRNLVEDLSSIAALRDVRIHFAGSSTATVPLPEARLRRALQHLIMTVIEIQPAGGKVILLLTESPAGTVLRIKGDGGASDPKLRKSGCNHSTRTSNRRDPLKATSVTTSAITPATTSATASVLRRMKIAIASRVCEMAGASLVLTEPAFNRTGVDPTGFVLRIPPQPALHAPFKENGAGPVSTSETVCGMVGALSIKTPALDRQRPLAQQS
jgi:hypothetical protein